MSEKIRSLSVKDMDSKEEEAERVAAEAEKRIAEAKRKDKSFPDLANWGLVEILFTIVFVFGLGTYSMLDM